MSVNEKMTALADEIRELSGTTAKKGIDAMISDIDTANTEISGQTDLLAQILAKVNRLPEAGGGSGSGSGSGEDLGRYIEGSLSVLYNEHATGVIDRAFKASVFLEEVTLPNVNYINSEAFQDCELLRKADFTNLEYIGFDAFRGCVILEALIIRNTELVVEFMSYDALLGTRISDGNGYIYVPRDLVDSYKNATNWVEYADQIVALEDNTIDGTTTGEIVLPELVEEIEFTLVTYPDLEWVGWLSGSATMTWGDFIFQEEPNHIDTLAFEATENGNIRIVSTQGEDFVYYVVTVSVNEDEEAETTLASLGDTLYNELTEGGIYVMPASELGLE